MVDPRVAFPTVAALEQFRGRIWSLILVVLALITRTLAQR